MFFFKLYLFLVFFKTIIFTVDFRLVQGNVLESPDVAVQPNRSEQLGLDRNGELRGPAEPGRAAGRGEAARPRQGRDRVVAQLQVQCRNTPGRSDLVCRLHVRLRGEADAACVALFARVPCKVCRQVAQGKFRLDVISFKG